MHKNRYDDQWYRIKELNMNPCSYAHLIIDKDTKNIQWRKDNLFNKCCLENQVSALRKLKLDPCLSPCTRIKSKWMKDLEASTRSIGIGKDFVSRIQVAQQLRERIDLQWKYVKLNSFWATKEIVSKL
jgi:hypothetical protein